LMPVRTKRFVLTATTVTMLGYSFSGATGAVWSGGSGSWAGDTYTPTAGEIASGSVVLTYTTSSAAPCAETSDTKTITFQALPLIDAGPDQTVCEDVNHSPQCLVTATAVQAAPFGPEAWAVGPGMLHSHTC
jgi:hypothetical protein